MEEFKRVLFNKKFLIGLLLLLLLNGWIEYREHVGQKKTLLYQQIYQEKLEKYRKMDAGAAVEELQAAMDAYDQQMTENMLMQEEMDENALTEHFADMVLLEQLEHIEGYDGYLDDVEENATKLKESSLFGNEGSFAYKNIQKTAGDFRRLRGVKLQLDFEEAFSAYKDGNSSGLLLLVMAVLVLLIFQEERKKGLWQYVYSMAGGRCRLAGTRACVLTVILVVTGILLEMERLWILRKYHGSFGDLSRAVQSNEDFASCVLKVTVGEYLAMSVAVKILVCVFVGMVVWILMGIFKSTIGVFAGVLAVIAGEYLAYSSISAQSSWNALKYMNLFSFVNSAQVLSGYHNLNLLGEPVRVHGILLIVMPVAVLLGAGMAVWLGRQRPVGRRESRIQRIFRELIHCIKPYAHSFVWVHEGYKILVRQRGWMVLVVLMVVCMRDVKTEEIYYDYETTLYHTYMEQLEGEYSDAKVGFLEAEFVTWQRLAAEHKAKIQEYEALLGTDVQKAGEVFASYEDYEWEKKLLQQKESGLKVVAALVEDAKRLKMFHKEGRNVGFVNEIGYEQYFGSAGNKQREMEVLCILAGIIFVAGCVGSFENNQNAVVFLRSVKKGRTTVFDKKCIWILVIAGVIVGSISLRGILVCRDTYGMAAMMYSVRSLELFRNFPVDISIWGMLVLTVGIRYLICLAVTAFVLAISTRCHNMVIAVFLNMLLWLVPAALVYAGIEALAPVSVMRPLEVTFFWNRYDFQGGMWFLPMAAVFFAGACVWFVQRKRA